MYGISCKLAATASLGILGIAFVEPRVHEKLRSVTGNPPKVTASGAISHFGEDCDLSPRDLTTTGQLSDQRRLLVHCFCASVPISYSLCTRPPL